jgi:hypothetical protein
MNEDSFRKEVCMDKSYIVENKRERERLHALISGITNEELTLILYEEGWTVAVTLAHLAFWDMRCMILAEKWKQSGIKLSPIDTDTINDVLVPFFLAIPPGKAAALSISTAEALDRALEELPPDLVDAIPNTGDSITTNRSVHRKMHLDDIEKLLTTHREKKSQV